ncbi:hypothetical protein S7711_04245 [Stachybotrys chartarum IBT 7711]|uniref:Uncharacterized protein n=1 Tax=Stachybotrys chartarum (strain CBS 109288 / IBT 7711) TaxID=1280523 RepID=A0A084AIM6_STACB|nr:hypothetical protein S7711_04245 [Stachybotrys chartarum IBT 7711]KFA76204.1 hypothetical protein S40288_07272 [Stachybotrys chartarum IBT 40288]
MVKQETIASTASQGAPQITQAELLDFFQNHFSDEAVAIFGKEFTHPVAAHQPSFGSEAEQWEEEDDLGYYSDGAKRTLTDEQIEIFRHSELEALRRQKDKPSAKNDSETPPEDADKDGRVSPLGSSAPDDVTGARVSKKRKRQATARSRAEPKPDLRKRTWDVVEAGLDSLDYD